MPINTLSYHLVAPPVLHVGRETRSRGKKSGDGEETKRRTERMNAIWKVENPKDKRPCTINIWNDKNKR